MLAWVAALSLGVSLSAGPPARVTVTLEPVPQDLPPRARYFVGKLVGPQAAERADGDRRIFELASWPPDSSPESRATVIAALEGACGCQVLAVQLGGVAPRTLAQASRLRNPAAHARAYDGARRAASAPAVAAIPARPAPDAALRRLVVSVAREPDIAAAGITPKMLFALATAASGFKTDFRYGDVYGIMAVSLPTAQSLGYSEKDLRNPRLNLEIGATLFAALLKQFDGNLRRALAAYQIGPRTVLASAGIPDDKNVRALLAAYDRAFQGGLSPADEAGLSPSSRPLLDVARRRQLYEGIAAQVAAAEHVDPQLIIAMMHAENAAANPGAFSKKRAQGLLQLMPKTARSVGVRDRSDPLQNLHGGSHYVRELLDRFKGDVVLAVAAYNCGPGCIERSGYKVPQNDETPDYVRKVFRDYNSRTGRRIDVEPYMAGR